MSVPAETPEGALSETDLAIFSALSNPLVTDQTKIRRDLVEQYVADQQAAVTRALPPIVEESYSPTAIAGPSATAAAVAGALASRAPWMAVATTTPQQYPSMDMGSRSAQQVFASGMKLSPSQQQQLADYEQRMSQHIAASHTSPQVHRQSLFEQQVIQQLQSPPGKNINAWQGPHGTSSPPRRESQPTPLDKPTMGHQQQPPQNPHVHASPSGAAQFHFTGQPTPQSQSQSSDIGYESMPLGQPPQAPLHTSPHQAYQMPPQPHQQPQEVPQQTYHQAYQQPPQQQQQQQQPYQSPLGQEIPTQHRYQEDDANVRTQKQIALLELQKLVLQGKVLTRPEGFTMNDPLTEMLTEIDGHVANENMVTMTTNITEFAKMVPYGIVMLNNKVKILKVDEEWADDFTKQENMSKMQGPIEKIYKRFLRRATMNPFLEIAMILITSLVVWDLRCRFKGSGKERRKASMHTEPDMSAENVGEDDEDGDDATAGQPDSGSSRDEDSTQAHMPLPPTEDIGKPVPNGDLDTFMKMMGGGA